MRLSSSQKAANYSPRVMMSKSFTSLGIIPYSVISQPYEVTPSPYFTRDSKQGSIDSSGAVVGNDAILVVKLLPNRFQILLLLDSISH